MVATLIEEKQFLRSAFKLDSFLSITESFSVTLSYKVVQELNSMKDTHTYFEIAPCTTCIRQTQTFFTWVYIQKWRGLIEIY